jgi:hypothetical protein
VTCLTSLCFLFCFLAYSSKGGNYLYLASAVAGVTIASKWNSWPIIIPLVYVFFISGHKKPADSNKQIISRLVITLLCLFAGFLLPSFQMIFKPGSYLEYALRELRSGEAGGFGIWQIDTVPGYIFYLKTLWYGIGGFLLVFGVVGVFRRLYLAWGFRDKASILLLAFPLSYFIIMGATRHYFARYALPLIPFLVLFAAEVSILLATWIENRWGYRRAISLTLIILVVSIQPLLNSIRYDFLLTRSDTRTIAKEWIENNIPAGAKIAIDWPIHGPPLVDSNQEESSLQTTYHITEVGDIGLFKHSLAYYHLEGYDYLIASSYIYKIPLVFEDQNTERKEFYSSLDNELLLVKEFTPTIDSEELPFIFDEIYGPFVTLWQRERPGPFLKLYRVDQ